MRFGRSFPVTIKNERNAQAPAGTIYTDSDQLYLDLIPSSIDTADFVDGSTISLKLTVSGVDTAQDAETNTVALVFIPSSVDTEQAVESGTAKVSLTSF